MASQTKQPQRAFVVDAIVFVIAVVVGAQWPPSSASGRVRSRRPPPTRLSVSARNTRRAGCSPSRSYDGRKPEESTRSSDCVMQTLLPNKCPIAATVGGRGERIIKLIVILSRFHRHCASLFCIQATTVSSARRHSFIHSLHFAISPVLPTPKLFSRTTTAKRHVDRRARRNGQPVAQTVFLSTR